jgi:predicted nuclease with TOPRIM domain
MNHPRLDVYLKELEGEHFDFERAIRMVRQALAEAGEQQWKQPAIENVVDCLRNLRCCLKAHFAQEDIGGYVEEALALAPHLSSKGERLCRQSRALYERVERLTHDAEKLQRADSKWPELQQRFENLAAALLAHEKAELELVQAAFNEDLDLL